MQNRILLRTDAEGVRTYLCRDLEANRQWIETEEPIDIILDQNARSQADFSRTSGLGNMVEQAVLPETLYYDLEQKGIAQDDKALRKFLNDSDNSKFRTNTLRL